MKKKLCTLAWGAVLSALVFLPLSCKKGIPPTDTTSSQTIEASELPGLRQLMALNDVPDSVKDALDLTKYQFYDKGYDGQHWIIILKKGAFNLEKAKIFVGLRKGGVSVWVLVYSYDESGYAYKNFKTYIGVISIYDGWIRKVNDLRYRNGILQQVIPLDCINCLLCYCPPPQPINWCICST